MRITEGQLRRIIRGILLREEVYGAMASVYTGSTSPPDVFIDLIVNDKLEPGKGKGGLYGKGLYTVYDLPGTQTEKGFYGNYIYKLAINLYGYLCFDRDVAVKVYGKPLTVIEQMELLRLDKDVIEAARQIFEQVPVDDQFTAKRAQPISLYVRGIVKGLVFTGQHDGRVAVVYDASTVTPLAYRTTKAKLWKKVSRDIKKQSVGRVSSDWRKERYEINNIEKLKRVKSKLERFRQLGADPNPEDLIIDGDLDLSGGLSAGLNPGSIPSSGITDIPEGLQVSGNLVVDPKTTKLPRGLKVGGHLSLFQSQVKEIPDGTEVGGHMSLSEVTERIGSGVKVGRLGASLSQITELPDDIQVRGGINLALSKIERLPDNLTVNGDLNIEGTPIRELPAGLHVTGRLEMKGSAVERIPEDLEADDGIYLGRSFKIYNVPQRLLKGYRKDGRQKVWFM